MTHPDLKVRPAVARDVSFLIDLGKKNFEALGFLPRMALVEHIDYGHVLVAMERGQHAAFLIRGAYKPTVRIFQACVEYPLRRMHIGLALIDHLAGLATRSGCHRLMIEVRDSLPAVAFWTAIGFHLVEQYPGGLKRNSIIDRMTMALPAVSRYTIA